MLAWKMHHCNGPKIQKKFYLLKKDTKEILLCVMCLEATLEKKNKKLLILSGTLIMLLNLKPQYDWMTNLASVPSSFFLDLIDLLNLRSLFFLEHFIAHIVFKHSPFLNIIDLLIKKITSEFDCYKYHSRMTTFYLFINKYTCGYLLLLHIFMTLFFLYMFCIASRQLVTVSWLLDLLWNLLVKKILLRWALYE